LHGQTEGHRGTGVGGRFASNVSADLRDSTVSGSVGDFPCSTLVDRMTTLFSIIESPNHPRFDALYQRIGITQVKLASQRKALQALKSMTPDWIVAEFFYGFGNNYAGANVSNLDVFLAALRKQAPKARTIVLVGKEQAQYVPRLAERFRIHAVLTLPVTEANLEAVLRSTQAL
jgi:hypothetical protein